MIEQQDITEAINECRREKNPNASTCVKLAAFYTILDHMEEDKPPEAHEYSFAEAPAEIIKYRSETEFGQEVYGRNAGEVLEVIDELMSTLSLLQPRLYQGVLMKIAD